MVETARDIFDEVADQDPFNGIETTEQISMDSIKSELTGLLEKYDSKERKKEKKEIISEVMGKLQDQISRIKPTQNVIERTINHIPVRIEPKKSPPQIIKEVRVEVEKKDTRKYAEESYVKGLEEQIKELNKSIESFKEIIPLMGGSGMVRSNDAYVPSNVTTTRSFNATLTSLNELASVVGSLIQSLQGAGLIK